MIFMRDRFGTCESEAAIPLGGPSCITGGTCDVAGLAAEVNAGESCSNADIQICRGLSVLGKTVGPAGHPPPWIQWIFQLDWAGLNRKGPCCPFSSGGGGGRVGAFSLCPRF